MKKKPLNLNDPKVMEMVERIVIDKRLIRAKKKNKNEITMPMKFNVGLQKYEPDLEKLKQIKKNILRTKKKILFICKYNRFRSRIAETYFNKVNKNKSIVAKSAGIIRGGLVNSKIIRLAKKFGLNIKGKPKGLDMNLLKWQNIIVVVADNVPVSLFKKRWMIRGKKLIVWKIPDKEESIKPIIKNVNKLLRQFGEED